MRAPAPGAVECEWRACGVYSDSELVPFYVLRAQGFRALSSALEVLEQKTMREDAVLLLKAFELDLVTPDDFS